MRLHNWISYIYYNSKYVGGIDLVEKLKSDPSLANQPDAVTGLNEMGMLLKYCSVLGISDVVCEYFILFVQCCIGTYYNIRHYLKMHAL